MCRNAMATNVELVRFSKSLLYERPYSVTGTIKLTGLKEAPKDICKAKIIGTWKAENMEAIQFRGSIDKEKHICYNLS